MAKKRKSRARQKPSKPPAFNGDHGPRTVAARAGLVVEPMLNEDGSNPNNMGRARRTRTIEAMTLTMRQKQAAEAIEEAWCRVQMLESGGPLKEQVDASPKPDATVAAQVDARSRWLHVTKPILRADMPIVRHICCDNRQIGLLARYGLVRASARFKTAMDRVADHLGY